MNTYQQNSNPPSGYLPNGEQAAEKPKKNVWLVVLVCVIALAILGALIWMAVDFLETPTITVEGNALKISGVYKQTIYLDGASISYVDAYTAPESRVRGTSFGGVRKGTFETRVDGELKEKAYLNIMQHHERAILIVDKTNNRYYINCKKAEDTNKLYAKLVQD